jgi:hypothetical protein
MLDIELKEDSTEKLSAINGKPTKYYLFAAEFNALVAAINANKGVIQVDKGDTIISEKVQAVTFNQNDFDIEVGAIDTEIDRVQIQGRIDYKTGEIITKQLIRVKANEMYLSTASSYPFTTTTATFAAEVTANKWLKVGSVDVSGKEDSSNKKIDLEANKTSDTFYASCKAIVDWIVARFQPLLVPGTNIKNINGNSILGSGDMSITSTYKGIYQLAIPNIAITRNATPSFYAQGTNKTYSVMDYNTGISDRTALDSASFISKQYFVAPYDCTIQDIYIELNISDFDVSIWKADSSTSSINKTEVFYAENVSSVFLEDTTSIPILKGNVVVIFIKTNVGSTGTNYGRFFINFKEI